VYESEAPKYGSAAYAMLGGYCGKTICHCILGWYMWRENKRRDRVDGPADPVLAADNGMKGMTEIESESGDHHSTSLRDGRDADAILSICRHPLPIRLVDGTWVPRCVFQGESIFGLRPELSSRAPLLVLRIVRVPYKGALVS
jgi:hypothetical protein